MPTRRTTPVRSSVNASPVRWFDVAVCVVLCAAVWPAVPLMLTGGANKSTLGYYDGPPPAHTGGFGEATCQECHFENDLNDSEGALSIEGIPDGYDAGRTYQLTVTLSRPGMQRGGFQIAARTPSGEQSGTLQPVDERSEVATLDDITYVRHTGDGTSLTSADQTAWTLEWVAPAQTEPTLFHAAANAANDDSSEFGDYIYTDEHRVEPLP